MSVTPAQYDLIRKPIITEKATSPPRAARWCSRWRWTRPSPRSRRRSRPVQRQGEGGQHHHHQGQGEAVPGRRHAARREEGLRDARRGQHHRRDHRALRTRTTSKRKTARHGVENLQADDAGPARAGSDRPFRAVEGPPGQVPHRGADLQGRAQQHRTDHHASARRRREEPLPHRGLQADQARRPRQGHPDRVRSEPDRVHRADRLCRRRAELHPGAAAARGRRHGDRRRPRPTSSRATRCRSRRCRSARSCTTSR